MKTAHFLSLAAAFVAIALASCSSGDDSGNGGKIEYGSTEYKGKAYKTVKIGGQTWMAENLDYDPGSGNSACYGNSAANCAVYGRLYDWEAAVRACNGEWHLPSDAEWQSLVDYAGGSAGGAKLKAGSGWKEGGNGEDAYGFGAMPGGFARSSFFSNEYQDAGYRGSWWTSTALGSYMAQYWDIIYLGGDVQSGSTDKTFLYSVRCVQK